MGVRTAIERLLKREPVMGGKEKKSPTEGDKPPENVTPPVVIEKFDQIVKVVGIDPETVDQVLCQLEEIRSLLEKICNESKRVD